MTQYRIEGRCLNCIIGSTDVASSFKYLRWRERADRVTPQTVANTVIPIGWGQGHRWVECELGIQSEATDAFSGYITPSGDNYVINTSGFLKTGGGLSTGGSGIVVNMQDSLGSGQRVHVVMPIVDYVERPLEDFETVITVYHLKAAYVTDPVRY